MNTSVVSPGRAGLILLLTGQMLPLSDNSNTARTLNHQRGAGFHHPFITRHRH